MQLLQMQKPRRRSDWTDLSLESAHFQLSFAICQSEVRKKAARSKNRTCKLKGTEGRAYDHALTSKFTKKFLQNSANIKIHRVKILQYVVFSRNLFTNAFAKLPGMSRSFSFSR